MQHTTHKNYGVLCPFSSKEVQAKSKKTMLERYGVEFNMQHREFFEQQQKSGFKVRKVRLSGKLFKVRGYESEALKFMVNSGCKVANIKHTAAEGVPSIQYRVGDKCHVYHPDFYVKKDGNWYIVEVKSSYTAGLRSDKNGLFNRLKQKAKATVDNGYRFILIVVGKNKQCSIVKNLHTKKRRQVIAELQPRLQAECS
jgi:hypothetical protein